MERPRSLLIIALGLVSLVGCWVGCSQPTYTGGNCAELPDCRTDYNYGGGTECVQGRCVCRDPGHADEPCCPGGGFNCAQEDFQCRPKADCEYATNDAGADAPPVEASASSSSAGGAGAGGQGGAGGGGPTAPLCEEAADCAEKPADARCGDVACINGECVLTFRPIEKIDSQIRGDCVSTYCDGDGATVVLPDGEDVYNDGKECTFDTCESLMAEPIMLPDGSPCPETGAGVCFEGNCVECIFGVADICGNGFACDGLQCVPVTCGQSINGMVDAPLETGVDCGGQCRPCFNPQTCKTATDCADGVCSVGVCALPSDSDGIKNDNETGVDCGCDNCSPCPDGFGCDEGKNCQSLVCWGGKCQPPKCNDGRQNGNETGVDCGPACSSACP